MQEEHPLSTVDFTVIGTEPVGISVVEGNSQRTLRFTPRKVHTVEAHVWRAVRRHSAELRQLSAVETLALRDGKGKVAIHRGGGLGDVLLLTPGIHLLRRTFPEADIWVLTDARNERVFEHTGDASGVTDLMSSYDQAPFDAFVELAGYVELAADQGVHRSDLFAQALGFTGAESYRMWYTVTDEDREGIVGLVPDVPYVLLQRSGHLPKRNFSQDKLQVLLGIITAAGRHCVVVDNDVSTLPTTDGVTDLSGKTTVAQLGAVVERATVVVAFDSGVLHLANALSRPTVGLFGPVAPDVRVKGQPNCHIITGNGYVGCGPCNDEGCKHPVEGGHSRCLSAIPPERIAGMVNNLWAS